MMRIIIAVGLLAVAVTGNPTEPESDDLCIPESAAAGLDDDLFSEPFPGQYERSSHGILFICIPWDDINARLNSTAENRDMSYIIDLLGQGSALAKSYAQEMACGSAGCK